ncbi:hypothetical protein Tco_1039328 [Tanacetum coccineum]
MSQEPCIFVHPHSNFQLEPVAFDQILHVYLHSLLVQEDGSDTNFAFFYRKTLTARNFGCSLVVGVKLDKVSGNYKACLEIDYVDFLKSQPLLKIKIPGIVACSLEVMMIKNKIVDKWLVKWKLKKLCGIEMNILKNCTNSFDPWGQGTFDEESIVMCLTQVWRFLTDVVFPEVTRGIECNIKTT